MSNYCKKVKQQNKINNNMATFHDKKHQISKIYKQTFKSGNIYSYRIYI